MFSFFKKNKTIIALNCKENEILFNEFNIDFPTNIKLLTNILGKPNRELVKNKKYFFWDELGIFCGCVSENEIISVYFYQNNKNKGIYNTKKQFKGKLFIDGRDVTKIEFEKITLGKFVINRLGDENQIKLGFSIGTTEYLSQIKKPLFVKKSG